VKIVTWQKPPLTCENAPFFHLFLIKLLTKNLC
jgi:hypothetical protein